jgi:hypothetical protein
VRWKSTSSTVSRRERRDAAAAGAPMREKYQDSRDSFVYVVQERAIRCHAIRRSLRPVRQRPFLEES